MSDYEVHKCTRRCAASDRPLKPGDAFYSVLVAQGADVVRFDYAVEAWPGPPENAIGWWKSEVPDPRSRKIAWAPNDVMLHYFCQLEGMEGVGDTRYVLALLMIRRRIVRLEETTRNERGEEELVVFCPKSETKYVVPVQDPTPPRRQAIQEELSQLLFSGNG